MSWASKAWRGTKGFFKDVGHGVAETGAEAYEGVHDAVFGAAPADTGGIVDTDPNAYGSAGAGGDGVLGPDARSALDDPLANADTKQTAGQQAASGISSVLSTVNEFVPLDDLFGAAIE